MDYAQQKTTIQNKTTNDIHPDKTVQSRSVSTFVDNRTNAVAQRRLQEAINNRVQAIQMKSFNRHINSSLNAHVIQLGKDRPGFSGPARKIKLKGHNVVEGDRYDMAHRLSFHDIQETVYSGDKAKIKGLIETVTIPQRKFGKYKKGYLGYYNQVKNITDADELVKALNNSPFNLRPGNYSVNRSIGAGFDGNIDDDGYETDQSEALRPYARTLDPEDRTSSYLSDDDLGEWEKQAFDGLDF